MRYRLVGTRAVEVTGFDITGRYLDELLNAEPDQPWMNHYKEVYSSRRPLLGATTVPTTLGEMITYEFGIFPLRKGGHSIEQFVAVEDYFGLIAKLAQVEPWRTLSVLGRAPHDWELGQDTRKVGIVDEESA